MRRKLILLFILVLAFFSRFYQYDKVPPSLYWDEVSIGYNAFSIIRSAKDEYGKKLPILFESFQEYKLPGQIYLTVPFVGIFGLNEFSVRFPSIIAGVFAVYFLYLLLDLLLNKKTALFACLLLTVSPWHIQFSRASFEAGSGLTILLLGLYLLAKTLKERKSLIPAFVTLSFSQYFYNSLRVFIPLFLCFFIVAFWRKLKTKKKNILIAVLFAMLVFLPLLIKSRSKEGLQRFSHVSVLNDEKILQKSIEEKLEDGNTFFARLIHHRYFDVGRSILNNYFSHFQPDFLFFGKDGNPRHGVFDVGLLYIWQLPFILLGFYFLLKQKSITFRFVMLWLILSPVAASFTRSCPHALRSLIALPAFLVFTSQGIYSIQKTHKHVAITVYTLFFVVFVYFLSSYFHQLFFHYSRYSSRDWAYGYKQVFEYVKNNKNNYQNIFITGKYWRPYIFALFYLGKDPADYHKNISNNKIDNMYFGHAAYDDTNQRYDYRAMEGKLDELRNSHDSLLIISKDEKHPGDQVIDSINDLKGEPIFLLVETKKGNR